MSDVPMDLNENEIDKSVSEIYGFIVLEGHIFYCQISGDVWSWEEEEEGKRNRMPFYYIAF